MACKKSLIWTLIPIGRHWVCGHDCSWYARCCNHLTYYNHLQYYHHYNSIRSIYFEHNRNFIENCNHHCWNYILNIIVTIENCNHQCWNFHISHTIMQMSLKRIDEAGERVWEIWDSIFWQVCYNLLKCRNSYYIISHLTPVNNGV